LKSLYLSQYTRISLTVKTHTYTHITCIHSYNNGINKHALTHRFVVLHCGDIPDIELIDIIEKRCFTPPSYCRVMVCVMKELQLVRERSSVFAGMYMYVCMYRCVNKDTWDVCVSVGFNMKKNA
jgi:hypothetical protein